MRLLPASFIATARDVDRPIAVLALISFVAQVGVGVMLPLLPLFAITLGATPGELGLMISVFAVTNTIGQLGSNWLLTWLTPRRQMPLGQGAYAAANFLIATSTSATPLIVFRGLSGFGGGLSIIADRLYIARVADRAKLAFTNSIVSAAGSSGSVLGPLIGGILAAIDLRLPFLVVGCTATIAAIGALTLLPPEPARPSPSAGTDTATSTTRWSTIRPLLTIGLWSLAFNATYGGWITTFAPYAEQRLGYAAAQVPLVWAGFGLGSIVFGPWLGRVADRTSRRRMVAVGSLLVLLNPVSMLLAVPLPVVLASAVVAGAGLSAAQSSWFALLTTATDGGWRGRGFGVVTALSNLGVIAGATLAAAVWERIDVAAALTTSMLFLLLGIASLALVRTDQAGPEGAPVAG